MAWRRCRRRALVMPVDRWPLALLLALALALALVLLSLSLSLLVRAISGN